MSNVKAVTRDRQRVSPYASEDSNSSLESLTTLATKVGKLHRYEDVKGRYDAAGIQSQSELTSDTPVAASWAPGSALADSTPSVATLEILKSAPCTFGTIFSTTTPCVAPPKLLKSAPCTLGTIFSTTTPGVATPETLEIASSAPSSTPTTSTLSVATPGVATTTSVAGNMSQHVDAKGNDEATDADGDSQDSQDSASTADSLSGINFEPTHSYDQLSTSTRPTTIAGAGDVRMPARTAHKPGLLDHFNVAITNRYGVLADVEMQDDTFAEQTNFTQSSPGTAKRDTSTAEQPTPTKNQRPPPICFLSRVGKHYRELCSKLDAISKDYHIQLATDKTLVYFAHLRHYKTFIETYTNKLPFYTYTPKGEKTHAYIVKGLPDDAEAEDIQAELRELDIRVQSVVRFRNTKYPIFMCVTPKNVTINDMRAKARYLQRARVYFEPHLNKKCITQCKKCQAWGHATMNCHLGVARCVKCAGNHLSRECDKEKDTPAKCANCGEDHPASSVKCAVYQREVQRQNDARDKERILRQANGTRGTQRYVPAPPPPVNAWTGASNFPPLPAKTQHNASRRQQEEPDLNKPDEDYISESEEEPHAFTDPRPPSFPRTGRGIPRGNPGARNRGRGGRNHTTAIADVTPNQRGLAPTEQPARGPRGNVGWQHADKGDPGHQHYLNDIASTMRAINKIIDLEKLSVNLRQLLSTIQKCGTPFECAMAIDKFNHDFYG